MYGLYEGMGVYDWPDGTKYEGSFKNNKIEGKGIWLWPNGDKYEGQFLDGKYNGFGVLQYKDGTKYQGEFRDDEFDGIGKKFIPMVLIMKEDFRKGNIMDMGFGIIIMEIN